MKKIILVVSVVLNGSYADLSVNQIEKMVLKIHEKRVGIGLARLENTKEPFIHIEVEHNESTSTTPEKKDKELSLHAILNNKVYINNGWYGLDDIIDGYTLKYIGKNGVVLRSKKRIKKLFLHEKKENYISIGKKD